MNKLKKICFVTFLFMLAGVASSHGQDLHFSQFFNSPLSINPANTGFIPDADYRIGANYRTQYSSVMTVPYKTISVFGDAQLLRDRLENGWLGLGGMVLSDVAGAGSLKSVKVYGSLAYHQLLGNSSLLSAGFNLGYASKRIDPAKLKFPDQFDGQFFDSQLPTSVVLDRTSINYFDLQTGINYAYFPTENTYINAGVSVHHVNQARESFLSNGTDSVKIPMRYIGFLNGIFRVGERVILVPNAYYTWQSKASELVGGAMLHYRISDESSNQFKAGAYYRSGDAIIPMAGLVIGSLDFTISYDATLSGLKNFNHSRGAIELSLIKKGFYPSGQRERQILCPTF